MSKVNILDCTLRDGGYINNWKFGKHTIDGVVKNLSDSNMDIIEIGFLTDKEHTQDDSLFTTTEELNKLEPNEPLQNYIVAILLSIVTCGIYGIYWLYKFYKKVDDVTCENNCILNLVLSLFFSGIVGMAIVQNSINRLQNN